MRYFAYGSNLNQKDLDKWCNEEKHGRIKLKDPKPHHLKGYQLGFTRESRRRRGGVADIIQSGEDHCWGVIFDVTDEDRKLLDIKEGCTGEPDSSYVRINLSDDVWTYVVREKDCFIRPSCEYVDLIINGATDHGLPEDWIDKLKFFRRCIGCHTVR